ncbi:hypothetical protein RCH33_1338 [Flavobacterium daejeonense]|nr:hypothetical protein RCH33_1338 [Flavobacterium daejeonense]
MKKTFLLLIVLYCQNMTAQIKNLSDYLEVSNLSVYGLTDYLQYSWKIAPPKEKVSSDRSKVIGTYTFTNETNTKQVLQRVITMEISSGIKTETTNLICKDFELLKKITKNLIYNGFELKGKQSNQTMYDDGNRILVIYNDFSEKTLGKGYYKLSLLTK